MSGYLSGRTSLTTVQTADIADNAITLAKMAGGTDGQVITYDASGSGFIAYKDLKESDGLGGIYEANKQGDETADEYKARIEAERTAKVQAQIDRAATQATGVPW